MRIIKGNFDPFTNVIIVEYRGEVYEYLKHIKGWLILNEEGDWEIVSCHSELNIELGKLKPTGIWLEGGSREPIIPNKEKPANTIITDFIINPWFAEQNFYGEVWDHQELYNFQCEGKSVVIRHPRTGAIFNIERDKERK